MAWSARTFGLMAALGLAVLLIAAPAAEAGKCKSYRSSRTSVSVSIGTGFGYGYARSRCAPRRTVIHRSYDCRPRYSYRYRTRCSTPRYGYRYGYRSGGYRYSDGYRASSGYRYADVGVATSSRPHVTYGSTPATRDYLADADDRRTYTTHDPYTGGSGVYPEASVQDFREWQLLTDAPSEADERPGGRLVAEAQREQQQRDRTVDWEAYDESMYAGEDDGFSDPSGAQPAVVVEPQPRSLTRVERLRLEAWQRLEDRDLAAAQARFAELVRADGTDDEARLGYIITSLRSGERDAAMQSLRGLLCARPEAVSRGNLPASVDLSDELAFLSDDLRERCLGDVSEGDRRLLASTVDFLRSETALAQKAVRGARRVGAEDIAARNLWRITGLSDRPLERGRDCK